MLKDIIKSKLRTPIRVMEDTDYTSLLLGLIKRYEEIRSKTIINYNAISKDPQGDGFDSCEELFFQAINDIHEHMQFKQNYMKE